MSNVNVSTTSSNIMVKTSKIKVKGLKHPTGFPKDDFRSRNSSLRNNTKSFIRRAGPRGG